MRGKALALAAAALLLVTGCSGDEAPESPRAAPEEPSPTQAPDPVCPMTGEDPPRGVELERAAVAVKVENSSAARPQSGLEHADVVFEEIVEGGITRFMALYHCGGSKQVGPVRSARFDDPKIALPFTRILAYSGSNKIVDRELKRNRMVALNELNSDDGFFRVPPGTLEIHNLFANVSRLRAGAKGRKVRAPKNVFAFGKLEGKGKKARVVTLHFNPSNTIEYRWKGGAWRRWEAGAPFLTKAGSQIGVPNVLVQQVEVNNSQSIVDGAGNPSPDIALQGKGRAWLFRNGRMLRGTWKVKRAGAPAVFRTRRGKPFTFAEGAIWVELVPSSRGAVKGSISVR